MSCYTEEKKLNLGERRRVTLEVWLNDGSEFAVSEPTWALLLGRDAEDSGDCDAVQNGKKWRLTCEVQPQKAGYYTLKYTFGLGTEIIVRNITLKVGG